MLQPNLQMAGDTNYIYNDIGIREVIQITIVMIESIQNNNIVVTVRVLRHLVIELATAALWRDGEGRHPRVPTYG
eukprot:COSAG01_NODE_2382_length_7770_cov_4.692318_5_plen_75_part_00